MGKKQVSALPFRRSKSGELRILLITSRENKRWILPKGWPMKGHSDWDAAQIEAREEAGIEGKISHRPIGSYDYTKKLASGESKECSVGVYPMLVERELPRWKEQDQRVRNWFSKKDAMRWIDDKGVVNLLSELESFCSTDEALKKAS